MTHHPPPRVGKNIPFPFYISDLPLLAGICNVFHKRRHQGLNRQTPDQVYWSTLPREVHGAGGITVYCTECHERQYLEMKGCGGSALRREKWGAILDDTGHYWEETLSL